MNPDAATFQSLADAVVENVLAQAETAGVNVELFYCIQQVVGPNLEQGVAYLLRSGENDAFLATDSLGRVWYCDCTNRVARNLTQESDFQVLSEDLLDALGFIVPDGMYPELAS
jgi:hypothetical protein